MTTATATAPVAALQRVPQVVWQVAVFGVVVIAWEVGAALVDKETFPSASLTFDALAGLASDGDFWTALRFTAQGWVIGLSLGILLGISLGLAIGRSEFLAKSSKGFLDFLRSIPGAAIIFIFLGLFESSVRMKYALVAQAAAWPIMIQSIYGARAMSATLHDFSAAYRITSRDRVFKLALPSAMPFIITGVRLAASLALIVNIVAEYWGSAPGLGREVIIARNDDLYPEVYALIVVAGALGVLLNRFVVLFDRRALSWHPKNRKND